MKFHWGTGILIFIIFFLLSASLFIAFAMRQDVSLVHKDYYEQGVDHSRQIKVAERSAPFAHAVQTRLSDEFLLVAVKESLALEIESGQIVLYRPSSSALDFKMPLAMPDTLLEIPRNQLTPGRYIFQFHWFSDGLKYEIEETVFIP